MAGLDPRLILAAAAGISQQGLSSCPIIMPVSNLPMQAQAPQAVLLPLGAPDLQQRLILQQQLLLQQTMVHQQLMRQNQQLSLALAMQQQLQGKDAVSDLIMASMSHQSSAAAASCAPSATTNDNLTARLLELSGAQPGANTASLPARSLQGEHSGTGGHSNGRKRAHAAAADDAASPSSSKALKGAYAVTPHRPGFVPSPQRAGYGPGTSSGLLPGCAGRTKFSPGSRRMSPPAPAPGPKRKTVSLNAISTRDVYATGNAKHQAKEPSRLARAPSRETHRAEPVHEPSPPAFWSQLSTAGVRRPRSARPRTQHAGSWARCAAHLSWEMALPHQAAPPNAVLDKYKGVHKTESGLWRAKVNGVRVGMYRTRDLALAARQAYLKQHYQGLDPGVHANTVTSTMVQDRLAEMSKHGPGQPQHPRQEQQQGLGGEIQDEGHAEVAAQGQQEEGEEQGRAEEQAAEEEGEEQLAGGGSEPGTAGRDCDELAGSDTAAEEGHEQAAIKPELGDGAGRGSSDVDDVKEQAGGTSSGGVKETQPSAGQSPGSAGAEQGPQSRAGGMQQQQQQQAQAPAGGCSGAAPAPAQAAAAAPASAGLSRLPVPWRPPGYNPLRRIPLAAKSSGSTPSRGTPTSSSIASTGRQVALCPPAAGASTGGGGRGSQQMQPREEAAQEPGVQGQEGAAEGHGQQGLGAAAAGAGEKQGNGEGEELLPELEELKKRPLLYRLHLQRLKGRTGSGAGAATRKGNEPG